MSLLIDLAIVVSLMAAMSYSLVLSNRLNKLMKILRDLEPAISEFSQAVDKSQSSATGLRAAAIQLAEEVGQAKGRTQPAAAEPPSRTRALPSAPASESDKSDLVRGFFNTLQERSGS